MNPLKPFWFQPKNAWWWMAHFLGLIFPLIGIVLLGIPLFVIDIPAALLSVALFVGLGFLTVFLLSRTPYAPEHGFVLVGLAFLYGAFISIGLTFLLGFGIGNLTTFFGTPMFTASFGGAVPEETLKLFCVLIILNLTRRWVYHPAQLMVIGMGVGLGFDVIENMSYGANSAMLDPNNDMTALLTTWGIRLLAGPFAHMVWTGISAWGLGQFIFNKKVSGLGWFGFSVLAHFLFNTQWPFDLVLPKSMVDYAAFGVITVVYVISLVVLIRMWLSSAADYAQAKANHVALLETYQEQVRTAYALTQPAQAGMAPGLGQMPSTPPLAQ